MKIRIPLLLAIVGTAAVSAQAQFSDFSWAGFNFTDGMQTVTASSLLSSNVPAEISSLTAFSLSNVVGNIGAGTGGAGTLSGTFGGTNYSGESIVIASVAVPDENVWGSAKISLLFSDNTASTPVTYTDANLTTVGLNTTALTSVWDGNLGGQGASETVYGIGTTPLGYLEIPISDIATDGQGVVGISITDTSSSFPDILFIGIGTAEPAPEPGTLALGALGLGGLALARRRK